jgi:hypothetical protein
MFDGKVVGRVETLSVIKGIKPQLAIALQFGNESSVSFDIVNLVVQVSVAASTADRLPGSPRFYVGRAFPQYWNLTLPARGEGGFRVFLDLDGHLLQDIQEVRRGRDLFLLVDAHLVGIERAPDGTAKRVGSDWVYDEKSLSNGFFSFEIARSKWLDLLKELGYGEYYLAEMPLPRVRRARVLEQSLTHLQRAWEHLLEGRDRETLAACYDALELLAKKSQSAMPDKNAFRRLLSGGVEEEKVKRLSEAFHWCAQFLHLGRHEHEPRVEIEHKDGELALLLTHACLAYVSKGDIRFDARKGGGEG